MTLVIITIAFAILNALRGGGFIARPICAIAMGFSVGMCAYFLSGFDGNIAFQAMILVFFGMWGGLALGWGKYFAVFTGNMDTVTETEVKVIDRLVNAVYGYPETVLQLKIWSFFAMSLRGLVFYPLFMVLAFNNPLALLCGLGTASMGTVYAAMNLIPEKHAVRTAEAIFGGVLGFLISLSL